MVADATVDCYDELEVLSGFLTKIQDNLAVPFETTVLGSPVSVNGVDLNAGDEIVAVCVRGRHRQSIPILDLPLPRLRPRGAEWISAYRFWCTGKP